MIGQQYRHKNGNIYTVIMLTNTNGSPERIKEHPVDVIYIGQNGNVWSRSLLDWDRSFTKINTEDGR